jgi:hypothetical protein
MAGIHDRHTDEELTFMYREFKKLNLPDSEFSSYVEYLEETERFNEAEHMNTCDSWSPE